MIMHKTILEKSLYAFILLAFFTGVFLSYFNPPLFDLYLKEDYFIEQATFIILFWAGALHIYRFFVFKGVKTQLFLFSLLGIGLLLIFAAGEEISWGQRIFNIESGDFFTQNNLQKETNLHNLKIYHIRFNTDIFANLQLVWGLFYFGIFPLLYSFQKILIDKMTTHLALYIPQKKHSLFILISTIVLYAPGIITHSRKTELYEFTIASLMLAGLLFPINKNILK